MKKKIEDPSIFRILSAKEKLVVWFRQNKRDLYFRKTRDPYQIWVSEVMLQQTRMNVMLPIYEKFIQRFPSLRILSESEDEELLFYWKGLGYYSRALNLKKGVKFVEDFFSGEIPKNLEDLLKIPGIGPYTARAISSIAFGGECAVLDGNVKRVIARIFQYEKPINSSSALKDLQKLADFFLNKDFPGDHNEALMELGALICVKNPVCGICPLSEICLSRKNLRVGEIPFVLKEKEKILIELHFLFFNFKGKFLLIKGKNRRFFKTIFTLPYVIFGEKLPGSYQNDKQIEKFFQSKKRKEFSFIGKHTITHHNIRLKVSEIILNSKIFLEGYETKWIESSSIEKEFHSSIAKKIFRNSLDFGQGQSS